MTDPPPIERDDELIERGEERLRRVQRLSVSPHGMAATAHYLATEAAVEMLEEGGNAIDAAVAAAFALGVCEPAASGLGGQTMMLVHLADGARTFALDGSSRAPNRAVAEAVPRRRMRLVGYRASTVPSTPATLDYALSKYGSLPLSRVLEPSIRYAEEGVPVTDLLATLMKREVEKLRTYTAGRVFLNESFQPFPVGGTLKQPALANTFRRLVEKGMSDFYLGEIAREIHSDMQINAGFIHKDDLALIPYPIERKALSGKWEGYRVQTMPPPGAGRTLIEILNILANFPPKRRDLDTIEGAILFAEIIRRAQLDRRDRVFDPNFYPQVQDKNMLSSEYATLVAKQVKARLKVPHQPPVGNGDTTHLSVMDRHGNAVALTQSIERVFGAFVMTPSLGFLYNNYMSAFEYKDITHPYYLRPNAVPWASVAPSILFRGRKPALVIGSPGSERIVSAISQILLRMEKQPPLAAVTAPRLHCSIDGKVSLEAARMRDDLPDALEARGFTIDRRDPYAFYMGCVQLVMQDKDGFTGVADLRRDGSAKGPAS